MVIVWSLREGVRIGSEGIERVGKLSLLVNFVGDCRRVESSGLVSRTGFSSICGISVLIDDVVEGDSERGFIEACLLSRSNAVEKSGAKFEIGREG